jgi:hypothetical protein
VHQALFGTEADNGNVTNGLLYAIKMHNKSKGAFPSFATTAMEWAITKYLEQQPDHTSLDLSAPINPDDEDGDTLQDMIIDEGPDVDDGDETRAIFL